MVLSVNREEYHEFTQLKSLVTVDSTKRGQVILNAMRQNPKISAAELALLLGISSRAVEKRIRSLRENGTIRRLGPDKGGHWEIL